MNIRSGPGDVFDTMSIDAFIPWAERQDSKYELVNGVPRVLPWVKRNHNRIVVNVVAALTQQIDRAAFEIATGDFAVRTGPVNIRYADVMVEASGGPGTARMAESPVLLLEVLSPSTTHDDFGQKATEYFGLESLQVYLVIDQEARRAWQWSRASDGNWPEAPSLFEEPDAVIDLPAISAVLRFDDVYRNVR